MATELYLPETNLNTIKWQIRTFLQEECGYVPTYGRHSQQNPDSLKLERRLNRNDAFPKYQLFLDFSNPYQIKTTVFFERSRRRPKHDQATLEHKNEEITRILEELEEFQGSNIYRLLKNSLIDALLFQTSVDLQEIKKATNHDPKQELINFIRSNNRLRNVQKSRFLRRKEDLALQDLSQY